MRSHEYQSNGLVLFVAKQLERNNLQLTDVGESAFNLRGRNIAIRTLVAVGDTVVVGCRRWRNLLIFKRRGVV